MKTYQNIKSAATIDAIVRYAETLLDIHFKPVKKNRYSAPCPFHADQKENFMVYVNRTDQVRFHCFGICKGDWDIYDLIMLRKNYGFKRAQQVWAGHLGIVDFKVDDGRSPCIPEPDETPEPDEPVEFVEPKQHDEKRIAALGDAAAFYHDLLTSNKDRFKSIWEYLAHRGVGIEVIDTFNIGYAPPYSDAQYRGRALIDGLLPKFDKGADAFERFSDAKLVRFLNDATV
ncbi:MAG: hypothetical protein KFF68_19330, partial [Desulfosarcina sp.]|nr:hypothetical protein [Desulfosarcina sp.]